MIAYKEIPIFINSFNRPTFLMQLIYKLHTLGYENLIIIDNGSTDLITPLYLSQLPYKVYYVGENKGPNVIWDMNILKIFGYEDSYYVYTDCDLLISEKCDDQFMAAFLDGLAFDKQIDKVGFSLVYKGIPAHYKRAKDVKKWEEKHWEFYLQSGDVSFSKAPIDTTFALYRPGAKYHSHNALRTGAPYVAYHLPWYENSEKPFFELENYRKLIKPNMSSWETEGLNKI